MTQQSRKVARAVAPTTEPISLNDAKAFMRVDGTTDDSLIGDMIVAVRLAAEEALRRSLITQRWRIRYADTLGDQVDLPFGPVQSVVSVTLYDEEGNDMLVDAGLYHVSPSADALVMESRQWAHRVEVIYQAGYGDAASDVPMDIRQGMLVHLLALYEQRDVIAPPVASMQAYGPYVNFQL